MRSEATNAALLAAALLATGPAPAQEATGRTELEEALGHAKAAPVIPTELRDRFREASANRLVIRGVSGHDIVIDISEKQPEHFEELFWGRYIGFSVIGYEYYGYILVDRVANDAGAVMETGARPVFSPDGNHFAAVQFSGSGWGNLEGFGLWRIASSHSWQRLFSSAFPPGEDWRIDGWPRSDCVAVSAVAPRSGGNARAPAERIHFGIEIGDRIAINATEGDSACGGSENGERGDG